MDSQVSPHSAHRLGWVAQGLLQSPPFQAPAPQALWLPQQLHPTSQTPAV